MKTETVSALKSPLPPLTDARLLRLRARVPLVALAAESGVPLVVISEWERGLREISGAQQEAVRAALGRLAVPPSPGPPAGPTGE